jgi:phage tail sheath protein FI
MDAITRTPIAHRDEEVLPMPFYPAPGVCVGALRRAARPIGAAGTGTAGFVGTAQNAAAPTDEAVAVNSWLQYQRIFGGPDGCASTPLSRAVHGFFANGGGRCVVVNVAPGHAVAGDAGRRSGLPLLEGIDEVAMVAAPGFADPLSHEALLAHCEHLGDRVAILDPPRALMGIDQLKRAGLRHTAAAGAADAAATSVVAARLRRAGLLPRQSEYGAFYFPWIVVRDPGTGELVATAPSGHVAGVWARNDNLRGVHKVLADEPLHGVVDLSHRLTRSEDDELGPTGINCLRYCSSGGVRLSAGHTLADPASHWRSLSVRRMFNMFRQSIMDGTRWIAFEANDVQLWRTLRRDINTFLTRAWRDGALAGRTPGEAFFVKCDEETNPPRVRGARQLMARIGLAMAKPAEYAVFELRHSMIGASAEVLWV